MADPLSVERHIQDATQELRVIEPEINIWTMHFGDAEVVWLGVGVVSICGGVGGRGVCFVWVVARCAQMWGGPGVAVSRCVCDDASRRLSFCCTCANMSFLSAKAASIEKD